MKIDTVILGILNYLYETSDEAMPSLLPIKPETSKTGAFIIPRGEI